MTESMKHENEIGLDIHKTPRILLHADNKGAYQTSPICAFIILSLERREKSYTCDMKTLKIQAILCS